MPEALNHVTPLPFWLRPLKEEDKPHYTECEKRIIAFSIAFEGTITILKDSKGNHYPAIRLGNTDFNLLESFIKIVKLGRTCLETKRQKWKKSKIWYVNSVYTANFLLQELKGFAPCLRYKKLRSLVAEFCQSRIHKHENDLNLSYDERELEIIQEVRKLNRRGRKP